MTSSNGYLSLSVLRLSLYVKSDVCRRQILTYKDGPRTEKNKIFIMAEDPYHRYSNEAERAHKTFMLILNLKNPLVSMVYKGLILCQRRRRRPNLTPT